jgi:hypothetical protein
MASGFRIRLIDMAGGVIGIVSWASETVTEGDTVELPDGRPVEVLEVYDDEYGQEGGVQATVVVDDGSVPPEWTS